LAPGEKVLSHRHAALEGDVSLLAESRKFPHRDVFRSLTVVDVVGLGAQAGAFREPGAQQSAALHQEVEAGERVVLSTWHGSSPPRCTALGGRGSALILGDA